MAVVVGGGGGCIVGDVGGGGGSYWDCAPATLRGCQMYAVRVQSTVREAKKTVGFQSVSVFKTQFAGNVFFVNLWLIEEQ